MPNESVTSEHAFRQRVDAPAVVGRGAASERAPGTPVGLRHHRQQDRPGGAGALDPGPTSPRGLVRTARRRTPDRWSQPKPATARPRCSAEFANHTRDRVVWYRLERSDGDWITFLSYLVAALRDIWPDFGRPTEALLRNVAAMGSSREVVLAQFLADLSSAERGAGCGASSTTITLSKRRPTFA